MKKMQYKKPGVEVREVEPMNVICVSDQTPPISPELPIEGTDAP
jgi:hypothetical protein